MGTQEHFQATLAKGHAVPTLLCGHCQSTLSRIRIFLNQGDSRVDAPCQTLAACSADDCGALNCCDSALSQLENPDLIRQIAS